MSTNLVFVPFDHLHVSVKWCSFFVSDSHVLTISGSLMSTIRDTCLSVWILALMVSSVLPSFCCCSLNLRISCSSCVGVGKM